MNIKQFVNNPFQENCWVVIEDGEALLIDCGAYDEWEEGKIARYVDDMGARVVGHLLTHGHLDHVFGTMFVHDRWGVKPTVHSKDHSMLLGLNEQCQMWGIPCKGMVENVHICNEGEVHVGHFCVRIIETPGHTQGGVCLVLKDHNNTPHVFTGDTLFDGGYGRTDLPGGNYEMLMHSLEKLETEIVKLRQESGQKTTIYPGHGGMFYL